MAENPAKPMRAVVFIDARNVYSSAREAFGWEDSPGHFGNFKPLALARFLTQKDDRELRQVRVYSGVPTARRDKKANAIQQRRIAAWIADAPQLVEVFPRPLRYPPEGGREKGVDVELAVDMVELAIDDAFDLAVLCSADNDLVPALQLIDRRCHDKGLESVAFEPIEGCEGRPPPALDIPGGGIHRRMLDAVDFARVEDRRNFVQSRNDPYATVGRPRWDKISNRMKPK